jgi:hypothetical protein
MKIVFTIILILLILGGVYYYASESLGIKKSVLTKPTINITSQEFVKGGTIPLKFTCDGDNVNPSLVLDRVPADAKSLVLIVDDPDSANTPFNHWLVFNMDPNITNIEENQIPMALLGTNDFDEFRYMGPCPEAGSHKYYFRIYALDIMLSNKEGIKRQDLDKAMTGHVMAFGETFGTYEQ